jgi:cytochrome c-type biogenesis protein CcmH
VRRPPDRTDRRWKLTGRDLAWAAVVASISAALLISIFGAARPRTPDDRIAAIARTVKCPTCQGQSAAESDAPASQAIRADIKRRLQAGQTSAEIRTSLVDRYGPDILLTPPAKGITVLVWILPAVVFSGGAALVALALRRRPGSHPTAADRLIVAAALAESGQHDRSPVARQEN